MALNGWPKIRATIREKERKSESKKESKVRYRESYQPKMSTQKVLISFDEYKKLKEVEKKYHEDCETIE